MIKTVCDELALSHFAMGFVLYFSTGKNFREEVRRLFSRCGVFSGRKHTGAFQSSLTNDAIKGHVSRLQSREKTKTADSTIPMTSVTGPTREKGTSAKHSGFFHFKTSKRRSDFPGLDQCGHRGERQPSKLSNMQKLKTNSDPFVPI
uniref:HTH_48 domain-containing protein n=1 Tax=Mesocestoides corti TaxID=53468 RepID=A0A5K3F055_MESCO